MVNQYKIDLYERRLVNKMECIKCGKPAKYKCKNCNIAFCWKCASHKDAIDTSLSSIILGGPNAKCPICEKRNLVRVD